VAERMEQTRLAVGATKRTEITRRPTENQRAMSPLPAGSQQDRLFVSPLSARLSRLSVVDKSDVLLCQRDMRNGVGSVLRPPSVSLGSNEFWADADQPTDRRAVILRAGKWDSRSERGVGDGSFGHEAGYSKP